MTMSSRRTLRSTAGALSESCQIQKSAAATPARATRPRRNKHSFPEPEGENGEAHRRLSAKPSTPNPKRARLASTKSPQNISAEAHPRIGELRTIYSTGDIDDATPPPFPPDRPAEPHQTNAPLNTPGGSRLITYSAETLNCSPSKTGIPRPTTTTTQLLEQACAHLIKADPRLKPIVEKHHCHVFSPQGLAEVIDPFQSLSSGIIAQQVSGAAAKSIKNKFISLFNENNVEGEPQKPWAFPKPVQVAACNTSFLRQAGLSERKAEYIKGLAEQFANGNLSAEMLIKASDEEVLEKLIAVRGLGKWSVEMFACFGLKRMDVFSTGDLGVQYDFLCLHFASDG